MHGKYTLHPVGDSNFHWELKARDAQTLLSSEIYTARAGAETGMASCRENSKDEARYERLFAHDKRPYFVLRAANGEIIGTSQMYTSVAAREKGIATCKESAPLALLTYAPVR